MSNLPDNFQGYRKRLPLDIATKEEWDQLEEHVRLHGIKSILDPENDPMRTLREDLVRDLDKRQESARNQALQQKNRLLAELLGIEQKRLEAVLNIRAGVSTAEIAAPKKGAHHAAAALVMLSDWHFEERVDGAVINGLNHYDLKVAQRRWTTCAQNSLRLIEKERHDQAIDTLVLWWGGDFISGYIHEELEESNYLSPIEATRFAKARLLENLAFYKANGDFKKIIVVCNRGNHGRVWKKKRVSTNSKNSFEWMLYKDIADMYAQDKQLEFVVPDGTFAYVRVFDTTVRFFHGDNVGYQGGIGGLTIPLIKAIHRLNGQRRAQYNVMGHFHQYWEATKDCICNGSGIGFNAYAQEIGAQPEPPIQGFRIIHSRHGLTGKFPIFCE